MLWNKFYTKNKINISSTGMIMRLLGKDILNQKINKKIKSYWIKKIKLEMSFLNAKCNYIATKTFYFTNLVERLKR